MILQAIVLIKPDGAENILIPEDDDWVFATP